MAQLEVPSLVVDGLISVWNTPPLYRSIFTFSLILSAQVIGCVSPACQLSPPFGEKTVIPPVNIVKFAFDSLNNIGSATLVIRIL
ncbi:MAG: hypothetical protein IIA49_05380 [Bacteroidetes bacterium]|nr:hypothetical protein [Bacteroidota bacterium]